MNIADLETPCLLLERSRMERNLARMATKATSMGIALHGKPTVREGARYRIDHCDLTALLYLQGYKKADFKGELKAPLRTERDCDGKLPRIVGSSFRSG